MADVKYVITADASGAVTEIKRLEESWESVAKEQEKASAGAGSLGGNLRGLMGAVAVGTLAADLVRGAMSKIKEAIGDVIKAAEEQERADTALRAALELTGRSIEGNLAHYKEYAAEIQRTTRFGDEQVQMAQALLLQLTRLDQQGMDRAIRGAVGLASVLGIDLQSAALMVAKAMEGNTAVLSRYGIRVNESLPPAEKQAQILEKLERFYGRATAEAQTFSGRMEQLKNVFGDAKEQIGSALVNNQDFIDLINVTKETIQRMMPDLKDWAGTLSSMLAGMARIAQDALEWWDRLRTKVGGMRSDVSEADKAWNKLNERLGGFSGVVDLLRARLAAMGKTSTEDFTSLAELAEKLWASMNEVGNNATFVRLAMGEFGEDARRAFMDIGGQLAETALKLGDYKKAVQETPTIPAEKSAEELEALKKAAEEARKKIIALNEVTGKPPVDVKYFEEYKNVYTSLSAAIGGELGKIVGDFHAVNTAAVEVKTTFESSKPVWEAITRTEMATTLRRLKQELDQMARSGQYTTSELNRLKHAIDELERQLKDLPRWAQKFVDIMMKVNEVAAVAFSGLNSIFSQAQRNREIALDNEYKKRVDFINATIKDEKQRQEALMALEAEYNIKRSQAQRAAAKEAKAVAMLQAIVNTAAGVARALADYKWPMSVVVGAIVGALGLVQVATIAKQPIPLARGAVFTKPTILLSETGQTFEVGEEGPEYLIPEKHLFPRGRNAPALAAAGGMTININSPLVTTQGLNEADLRAAGEKLFAIIEFEMRRRGRL